MAKDQGQQRQKKQVNKQEKGPRCHPIFLSRSVALTASRCAIQPLAVNSILDDVQAEAGDYDRADEAGPNQLLSDTESVNDSLRSWNFSLGDIVRNLDLTLIELVSLCFSETGGNGGLDGQKLVGGATKTTANNSSKQFNGRLQHQTVRFVRSELLQAAEVQPPLIPDFTLADELIDREPDIVTTLINNATCPGRLRERIIRSGNRLRGRDA